MLSSIYIIAIKANTFIYTLYIEANKVHYFLFSVILILKTCRIVQFIEVLN